MTFPFSYIFVPTVSNFFFSIGLDFYVLITTDHPTLREKCRLLRSGIPFGPPVLLGSHLGGRFIACLLCCRGLGFFFIILEIPFPSFLLPESSVSSLLVCEYIFQKPPVKVCMGGTFFGLCLMKCLYFTSSLQVANNFPSECYGHFSIVLQFPTLLLRSLKSFVAFTLFSPHPDPASL